jgi:hypothetical protein
VLQTGRVVLSGTSSNRTNETVRKAYPGGLTPISRVPVVDDPDEPGFTEPPRSIVSGMDPRRLYAVIAVLLVVIVVLASGRGRRRRPSSRSVAPQRGGPTSTTSADASGRRADARRGGSYLDETGL